MFSLWAAFQATGALRGLSVDFLEPPPPSWQGRGTNVHCRETPGPSENLVFQALGALCGFSQVFLDLPWASQKGGGPSVYGRDTPRGPSEHAGALVRFFSALSRPPMGREGPSPEPWAGARDPVPPRAHILEPLSYGVRCEGLLAARCLGPSQSLEGSGGASPLAEPPRVQTSPGLPLPPSDPNLWGCGKSAPRPTLLYLKFPQGVAPRYHSQRRM